MKILFKIMNKRSKIVFYNLNNDFSNNFFKTNNIFL